MCVLAYNMPEQPSFDALKQIPTDRCAVSNSSLATLRWKDEKWANIMKMHHRTVQAVHFFIPISKCALWNFTSLV